MQKYFRYFVYTVDVEKYSRSVTSSMNILSYSGFVVYTVEGTNILDLQCAQ